MAHKVPVVLTKKLVKTASMQPTAEAKRLGGGKPSRITFWDNEERHTADSVRTNHAILLSDLIHMVEDVWRGFFYQLNCYSEVQTSFFKKKKKKEGRKKKRNRLSSSWLAFLTHLLFTASLYFFSIFSFLDFSQILWMLEVSEREGNCHPFSLPSFF